MTAYTEPIEPPFVEIFKPANRDAEVNAYCDQDDYDDALRTCARDSIAYDEFTAENCIAQMLYLGWETDDDDIAEARRLIQSGAKKIVIVNTDGFDEFFVDEAAPTWREAVETAIKKQFGAQVWRLDRTAVEQELGYRPRLFSRWPELRPIIHDAAEQLGWAETDDA